MNGYKLTNQQKAKYGTKEFSGTTNREQDYEKIQTIKKDLNKKIKDQRRKELLGAYVKSNKGLRLTRFVKFSSVKGINEETIRSYISGNPKLKKYGVTFTKVHTIYYAHFHYGRKENFTVSVTGIEDLNYIKNELKIN